MTVKPPANKVQKALQELRLHNPRPLPTTQPRFLRAADIVVHKRAKAAPRTYKTALKQHASKRKAVPTYQSAHQDSGDDKRPKSVLSMLLKDKHSDKVLEAEFQSQRRARARVGTKDVYVRSLLRDSTHRTKVCSPWITPPRPASAAATVNEERKRNGEQLLAQHVAHHF